MTLQNKTQIGDTGFMLLGLAAGLFFFTLNITGFGFQYFPGDLADGRLNLYFLEHAHQFFTGKTTSFWDAPFMYPEKNVIAYSDNLLGSAPLYSAFRLLGFDTFRAYQLWFVLLSALNYAAAFYFLKYVFKNRYAAVLGALIFAFSLALQSQLTHAQTFPRFAIPLAFLMAVKFGENLGPRYFFLTLFFVVYQIYCGIYLGFMLAIPVAIYLLINILRTVSSEERRHIFSLPWFLKISVFTLVNIGILLPLMLPYLERKTPPDADHFQQILHTIPTLTSHLFSQEGSLAWGSLDTIGRHYQAWYNHQIFAGGVATICLLIAFFWLISYFVRGKFHLNPLSVPLMLTITGLLTFILYLRFNDTTAYIALYYLPGFSSMRSLTRIINIELLFFAIATAWVFSRLYHSSFRPKALLFLAGFALIVFDNYFYTQYHSYKTPVSAAIERTAKIETAFARLPMGSVVSYEPLELESAVVFYQLDAMLTAQRFGLKTINGYTAKFPKNYEPYWGNPKEKSRNYWLQDKQLEGGIIYIVKGEDILEKVIISDIVQMDEASLQQWLIDHKAEYIKGDEEWMKIIEQRALERGIPVDSMLFLDAKWAVEFDQ